MLTDLLPAAEKIIRERYNVLDIINLLEYDHDPNLLYNHLASLYKNHYDPTDRIVFLHLDTDFYINNGDYPGFTIANLQRILSDLNIPNYFVLLITNHQHIGVELEKVQTLFSGDLIPIPYVICQLQQCWINPSHVTQTALNEKLVIKKFACLNGANRIHRTKFIQLLKLKNLMNDGIVSYNQTAPTQVANVNQSASTVNPDIHYLTTTPYTRVNDLWNIKKINDLVGSNLPNSIKLDGLSNDINSRYQFLELQKSFVYVITETVFNYPHPFLSEKSYKGITAKRPFIMIGAKDCLSTLQRLGYKTFSNYWDESYDQISDPADRLIAAFTQLEAICKLSIDELQNMLISMNEILEHNFNNYMNSVNVQLSQLHKDII